MWIMAFSLIISQWQHINRKEKGTKMIQKHRNYFQIEKGRKKYELEFVPDKYIETLKIVFHNHNLSIKQQENEFQKIVNIAKEINKPCILIFQDQEICITELAKEMYTTRKECLEEIANRNWKEKYYLYSGFEIFYHINRKEYVLDIFDGDDVKSTYLCESYGKFYTKQEFLILLDELEEKIKKQFKEIDCTLRNIYKNYGKYHVTKVAEGIQLENSLFIPKLYWIGNQKEEIYSSFVLEKDYVSFVVICHHSKSVPSDIEKLFFTQILFSIIDRKWKEFLPEGSGMCVWEMKARKEINFRIGSSYFKDCQFIREQNVVSFTLDKDITFQGGLEEVIYQVLLWVERQAKAERMKKVFF